MCVDDKCNLEKLYRTSNNAQNTQHKLGVAFSYLERKKITDKLSGEHHAFNSIIINSLDTCTPLRHVRLHSSDKEWMTPHIKDQIRARQKAWVKGDKEKYQQKREMVAALISSDKRKFYEGKASDLRYTNPSKWFKYIYSLCGAQQL